MRVLLADDESDFRELLTDYLARHGFEIVHAADGFETLLQVTRQRLDAVVLDLRMPRLGGIDALWRIRAFDPTIAVIVVTAAIEPGLHHQARALGARAVFSKPVVLTELLATLQGHVAGHGAADERLSTRAAAPPAAAPPAPEATRVLVVEDEAEIRQTLEDFLRRRGYQVQSAADGVAGLRAITEAPPDVVLLDIGLPGLSGADALPAIRAVAPRAAVIMVTGSTDRELARRVLAHGAFDYLLKPVNFTYLAESIESAVRLRAFAA